MFRRRIALKPGEPSTRQRLDPRWDKETVRTLLVTVAVAGELALFRDDARRVGSSKGVQRLGEERFGEVEVARVAGRLVHPGQAADHLAVVVAPLVQRRRRTRSHVHPVEQRALVRVAQTGRTDDPVERVVGEVEEGLVLGLDVVACALGDEFELGDQALVVGRLGRPVTRLEPLSVGL